MGMTSISQKIKNSSRSSEQKTPRTLVSSTSSQIKNSLVRVSTCQEIRTAIKPSKPVNTTSGRLMPSTPR